MQCAAGCAAHHDMRLPHPSLAEQRAASAGMMLAGTTALPTCFPPLPLMAQTLRYLSVVVQSYILLHPLLRLCCAPAAPSKRETPL